MRREALAAFTLFAASSAALAGAWTAPQGDGQVIVTATTSEANRSFDASGQRQDASRRRKFEIDALIEYGLTDWLTLMLDPGFQHIDVAAPTAASRSGLGYSSFGLRYRAFEMDGWVFSGQALGRIPGTTDASNPAAVGYTDTELDLRALLGKTFLAGGMPAFVNLELAQRFRSGDMPHEFRADATFGIRTAARWMLLAQSFNVISDGRRSSQFPAYSYSKLQLSTVYDISAAWSVQFGGYTTFTGRNALQENGVLAAIWYRF